MSQKNTKLVRTKLKKKSKSNLSLFINNSKNKFKGNEQKQLQSLLQALNLHFKRHPFLIKKELTLYESIELPLKILNKNSREIITKFLMEFSDNSIIDFVPTLIKSIFSGEKEEIFSVTTRISVRLLFQLIFRLRYMIFQPQVVHELFNSLMHLERYDLLKMGVVDNLIWSFGQLVSVEPANCLKIWLIEFLPIISFEKTDKIILLKLYSFLELILQKLILNNMSEYHYKSLISPTLFEQLLRIYINEIYIKNNHEKIAKKLKKIFPLLVNISLFGDPESPRRYFIQLLSLLATSLIPLRTLVLDYISQCLERDFFCFQVWCKAYPLYIPQSNNLILHIMTESPKYKIDLKKCTELCKTFTKINKAILSGKFKQFLNKNQNQNQKSKQNFEKIFDNKFSKKDIKMATITFKAFRKKASKKRKKALLLLLLLSLALILLFLRNLFFDFIYFF
ncbi:transmembrane protein [Anaeramoeba ignava]|uniref:Transmembrane protein n=1 Tax=Anaeramoeba ignava TaxID=1746090 RepID=A0A9Q0LFR8_ANAIG|nr:transmembrane protein [Anaeramoeba ignava]